MRIGVGDDTAWQASLASVGIRTAILAWFDFESGAIGVWTGSHPITVSDADTLLNGKTFEPIVQGTMINVGVNNFSYSGSDALTLSLAIPDTPTDAMANASTDSSEYQGRVAIIWRALMVTPPTTGAAAVWAFKRTRAGSMDELNFSANGQTRTFTLSIEGHASIISNASGSTYLDQKKFDSADTSQDSAVNIANNPQTPTSGSQGSYGGAGGGDVGSPNGGNGLDRSTRYYLD